MLLHSDVSVSWDCRRYHSYPLLIHVSHHHVGLVSQQLLVWPFRTLSVLALLFSPTFGGVSHQVFDTKHRYSYALFQTQLYLSHCPGLHLQLCSHVQEGVKGVFAWLTIWVLSVVEDPSFCADMIRISVLSFPLAKEDEFWGPCFAVERNIHKKRYQSITILLI